jgi:hypothetical protein
MAVMKGGGVECRRMMMLAALEMETTNASRGHA